MQSRRRQKSDNYRRSENKRPPRVTCSWQPTVPSWEKAFCKVIGSLDWETLLQMKKFTHLYENVIKWDDSAGEEAFLNAKKRFWAEINGLPCDIPLPDPDLYIDKIDWDSQSDSDQVPDLDSEPLISNADEHHDPVVIFGDSLLPNQAYSLTGWGDDDENFKVPANSSSANHGSPWTQNWGDSYDNAAAMGWPGYSSNPWQFPDGSGPAGYTTWGGGWDNNDWGWNYSNNNMTYEAQPDIEQGQWNDNNVNAGGNASRVQGNDRYRNQNSGRHKATYWGKQDKKPVSREWNSFNSCKPGSHHAGITVGQRWNQ